MRIDYINVIEDSFDTSLHIDLDNIAFLERRLWHLKEMRPMSRSQTVLVRHPHSFKDSRLKSSKGVYTFKLDDQNLLSLSQDSESEKRGFKIPMYCPPSKDILVAFNMFVESFDQYTGSNKFVPKKPQLPGAKTNTQLSTYIHKLYVYEEYLKREIDRYKRMRTSSDFFPLKHNYDESLSRTISRSVSLRGISTRFPER